MRCDLSCRGPIGVQQPGGGTVRGVALVALQRPLDGSADDRMDEARRVGGGQHLPAHEAGGQRHRRGRLHGSDRSRVAQRASVSEDGQRLRQAEGVRIEAAHARHHPSRDLLDARRQEHGGVDRGRSRVVGCDRPQQLGQVKGIAAACRPDRRAELIVGPPAGRRPHDRGGGGLAQQRGAHDHRCLGPQRRQRRAGRRRLVGAQRDQQRQLQPLQPSARGRPASAARARLPSARHRRRPTPVVRPQDWRRASTGRARRQTTCRRPASLPPRRAAAAAPRQRVRRAVLRALGLRRPRAAARTAGARRRTRSPPRAPTRGLSGSRGHAPPPAGRPRRPATSSRSPPDPRPGAPRRRVPAACQPPRARVRARPACPQDDFRSAATGRRPVTRWPARASSRERRRAGRCIGAGQGLVRRRANSVSAPLAV